MDGGEAPEEILRVPPKGIETRRSTGIVAVDDRRVAQPTRYIWDHYANSPCRSMTWRRRWG